MDIKHSFSTFAVKDLAEAKEFYSQTLGLTVEPNPDMPEYLLDIKVGDGATVTVYAKSDHQPSTYTILNLIVPDIEKAVDELTSHGVAFEHYSEGLTATDDKGIARGGGPLIAWFRDPSGNVLSLIEA